VEVDEIGDSVAAEGVVVVVAVVVRRMVEVEGEREGDKRTSFVVSAGLLDSLKRLGGGPEGTEGGARELLSGGISLTREAEEEDNN
jgi:hypothetical protein